MKARVSGVSYLEDGTARLWLEQVPGAGPTLKLNYLVIENPAERMDACNGVVLTIDNANVSVGKRVWAERTGIFRAKLTGEPSPRAKSGLHPLESDDDSVLMPVLAGLAVGCLAYVSAVMFLG